MAGSALAAGMLHTVDKDIEDAVCLCWMTVSDVSAG